MKKIQLFKPHFDKREVDAISSVLLSGWVGLGPKVKEFEEKFSQYVGNKYPVALNSGTSALHLSLLTLGVKRGDEVITTPITFAATSEAILYVGAKPVYADVEEDTLNIDPKDIERKITNKTKAILVVHYGGQPCRMDRINAISKKYNIPVIEDAAHACGASYKNSMVGSSNNLTCFSLHAVKNLATADGGIITTNDESVYKDLLKLRWFGIDKSTFDRSGEKGYSWDYSIDNGGYKYHMNDINAAIGLVQLNKLDKLNSKRKKIVDVYNSLLNGSKNFIPLKISEDFSSSNHIYCIKLVDIDRVNLMNYLSDKGIDTGVHYKPLYYHKRYSRFRNNTPVTDKVWPTILSLPLHVGMTLSDAKRVIRELNNFLS